MPAFCIRTRAVACGLSGGEQLLHLRCFHLRIRYAAVIERDGITRANAFKGNVELYVVWPIISVRHSYGDRVGKWPAR